LPGGCDMADNHSLPPVRHAPRAGLRVRPARERKAPGIYFGAKRSSFAGPRPPVPGP